ncbi:hypothetical protein TNCV_205871 [Trichonephila clavipes]|nr:hypothetical protein TNCV_205871 [Trichonephila clavipes]
MVLNSSLSSLGFRVLVSDVYTGTVVPLGKTPKETYAMLLHVHEDQALSNKSVYEWFVRSQEDRDGVSDKTRS